MNRISIGVQSFSEPKLQRLGRIHGPEEAKRAARLATSLGLRSFNLDLMHGLPDQTLEEALDDLRGKPELEPAASLLVSVDHRTQHAVWLAPAGAAG